MGTDFKDWFIYRSVSLSCESLFMGTNVQGNHELHGTCLRKRTQVLMRSRGPQIFNIYEPPQNSRGHNGDMCNRSLPRLLAMVEDHELHSKNITGMYSGEFTRNPKLITVQVQCSVFNIFITDQYELFTAICSLSYKLEAPSPGPFLSPPQTLLKLLLPQK